MSGTEHGWPGVRDIAAVVGQHPGHPGLSADLDEGHHFSD
jgi:hypothetical protein